MSPPSLSLIVSQPSTFRLTPLLCKEGCGEVERRLFYPTQPPLTKGRRERLSPYKGEEKASGEGAKSVRD